MRATPIKINNLGDWQAIRKTGLGGSEIAGVAGISPWLTPLDVFLQKCGLAEPIPETPAMRRGKHLEAAVADIYAEETGQELERCPLLRDADEPWILGSPDRLVKGKEIGVELKTANSFTMHSWGPTESDEVPLQYLTQCMWYVGLLGYQQWDLGVLFGTSEFRVYHIYRDQELIDQLRSIGWEFWQKNVTPQVPPPLSGNTSTARYLAAKYPNSSQVILPADAATEEWARRLAIARRQLAEVETEKLLCENQIKEVIKDNAGVAGKDWSCTWKRPKDQKVIDWQGICQELKPDPALITLHTTFKPGTRRFLARFPGAATNGEE